MRRSIIVAVVRLTLLLALFHLNELQYLGGMIGGGGGVAGGVQAFTAQPLSPQRQQQRPSTLSVPFPFSVSISSSSSSSISATSTTKTTASDANDVMVTKTPQTLKEELLILLGGKSTFFTDDNTNTKNDNEDDEGFTDEILFVDPITKQPLRKRIQTSKELIVGGTTIIGTIGSIVSTSSSSGSGSGSSSRTTLQSTQSRIQRYEYRTTSSEVTSISKTILPPSTTYIGMSDTYINLLEPYTTKNDGTNDDDNKNDRSIQDSMKRIILPFVPIPFRSLVLNGNNGSGINQTSSSSSTYIPMRDLFTSPTVSYLYERGWRQGFAQAGFPGVDTESIMAYDYLQPALIGSSGSDSSDGNGILVDMSCATGLFTRKFLRRALQDRRTTGNVLVSTNDNSPSKPVIRRLIGADYSDAMLREARQRINTDDEIQELLYNATKNGSGAARGDNHHHYQENDFIFELVRLDVGMIPMRNNSVDALHAGAAMHCWPEIDRALSEIYRVLRPHGGRYFATTFLSNYFRNTQQQFSLSSNNNNNPRQQIQDQTFQYFASVDELRALLIKAGFTSHQIQIDVVGTSCVIIRCQK